MGTAGSAGTRIAVRRIGRDREGIASDSRAEVGSRFREALRIRRRAGNLEAGAFLSIAPAVPVGLGAIAPRP
jgi:hypothetical protein